MWKLLAGGACCAALAFSQSLPVKRVVLYKNGVGYFEHQGTVRANDNVTVSFTSAQLNDVLKSLNVLDLNGGQITGVGYDNAAPVARQLSEMHLPTGENVSIGAFLDALRGSKVQLRNGAAVLNGRILGVNTHQASLNGRTVETQTVSLLTDNGELRSMDLSPAVAVRLLEPGMNTKLGGFLNALSGSLAPDERRMVISTAGSGDRQLFVSYISEVPIWKTTYRIALDNKDPGKASLQAWAIVDNTVGEDWNNVQLSLVAGAPQSFVQNLSQPYYAKRPVVALPQYASTTPQTHEETLSEVNGRVFGVVTDPSGAALASATVRATAKGADVQQTFTDAGGRFSFDNLPQEEVRLLVSSTGFQQAQLDVQPGAPEQHISLNVGSTSQTVEVQASSPKVLARLKQFARLDGTAGGVIGGTGSAAAGALPPPPVATGQELGDLFEYKLDAPITIARNRSALVPIAQTSLTAEKVSLYNESAGFKKPQRALWFTNTSQLTLDGGSVSVSDGNAFAGEGILDAIRPGEKRLFSYATDLALNVSTKSSTEPLQVIRVSINRGILKQQLEVREKKLYTVRNADSQPRRLIIEHPLRSGYEIRGDVKPVETTNNYRRFALTVPPNATATLAVDEARPTSSTIVVDSLDSAQVALLVRQGSIDPAMRTALEKIAAQKQVIAELEAKKQARDAEMQKIVEDQQRIRENIKALRGTPEEKPLRQRYTTQLNDQENRLPQLSKESETFNAQIDAEESKLREMINALSF